MKENPTYITITQRQIPVNAFGVKLPFSYITSNGKYVSDRDNFGIEGLYTAEACLDCLLGNADLNNVKPGNITARFQLLEEAYPDIISLKTQMVRYAKAERITVDLEFTIKKSGSSFPTFLAEKVYPLAIQTFMNP
jgi:hypothetical protein